jgi:hypothetical protein
VALIVKLEEEFCSKALPGTNPLDPTKACDIRSGPQVAVLVEPNTLNAEFNATSQLVASQETKAIVHIVPLVSSPDSNLVLTSPWPLSGPEATLGDIV